MLNNKVNVEDLLTATAAVVMENANKEDAVTIAVTRDGKCVYLGADQVPHLDEPGTGKITDKLTNKTDKQVFLRADVRRQLWQGDATWWTSRSARPASAQPLPPPPRTAHGEAWKRTDTPVKKVSSIAAGAI